MFQKSHTEVEKSHYLYFKHELPYLETDHIGKQFPMWHILKILNAISTFCSIT